MTSFYVLKRYRPTGLNWPLLGGLIFSLAVWAGVILVILHALQIWKSLEQFLQKVGLGG